jgi:hypothetical protein
MNNVVNELDALRNALSLESTLRDAANKEYANRDCSRDFLNAHEKSILQAIEYAKKLVAASETLVLR